LHQSLSCWLDAIALPKGFLERKYPGATVTEGPKALTIFETPEDHETAVTITVAKTGTLRRQAERVAAKKKSKP
jgi:hypothetical protein